jgi:hypothetical protein
MDRIADCGLRIANKDIAVLKCNPQSEIRNHLDSFTQHYLPK